MVLLQADITKSLKTTSTAPSAVYMLKWHEVETRGFEVPRNRSILLSLVSFWSLVSGILSATLGL